MSYVLEFYQPTFVVGSGDLITFKVEDKKAIRISSLDDILVENCSLNLNIDKKFDNELELKNWLIDNNYSKRTEVEDYVIYSVTYHIFEKLKCTSLACSLMAVWKKN